MTARISAERLARRRRQPDSLNRMISTVFGLPEECLDPDYHYHWVNDVRGRVQMLTSQDDYDIVTAEELEDNARRNRKDFHLDHRMGQNGSTISVPVEKDGTRAVLLKKPKDFYDYDYDQAVQARQAMMEARVFHGDVGDDADEKKGQYDGGELYVPEGNTLGDTAPRRRRGPIPRRYK